MWRSIRHYNQLGVTGLMDALHFGTLDLSATALLQVLIDIQRKAPLDRPVVRHLHLHSS